MEHQLTVNSERNVDSPPVIAPDSDLAANLSEDLVLVALKRDKQAFTRLFSFFSAKIKRFGMKQFSSDAQANELVQETMTNVWRKAHLYKPDKGAATTWVYTIMRNASFDMLRKIKNLNQHQVADDIFDCSESATEEQEQHQFSDHLMEKQMLEYVDSLPDSQKAVVKGVYYQELSQEQIATQLGIPVGTVKSRLRLALAKLKKHLGEQHD